MFLGWKRLEASNEMDPRDPVVQGATGAEERKTDEGRRAGQTGKDVTSDETSHKNSHVHARVGRRASFRSWPFRQP